MIVGLTLVYGLVGSNGDRRASRPRLVAPIVSVLILRVALLALAAAWFLAWPARAQSLTSDEARSVIAPFCQMGALRQLSVQ